jgi:nucleoside-diphosphate-sugar epimerase
MFTTLRDIRVLVTGISGFIGSHLARRLHEEGAEVHGLVRENSNLWRIQDIKSQINLHYVNIRDFESAKKVIPDIKPQKVFHLAAYVDVSRSFEVMGEMIEVNIKGTLNLLRALDGIDYDCFINTGTCEEYGDNPVPFQEDQIPNPVSPYSASKVSTSMFCKMLHKTMGLPIITLRPFLTYGPMQESNMLIPSLIIKAIKRERFEMTAGEQTREFNYVDDIVDGFIKASVTKKAIGVIINIGNGKEYRIKDVVVKILNIMGNPIEPLIGVLPYREGETMHFYCDNTKARELLSWNPKVSLDEGLKKTVNWYTTKFKEDR